MNDLKAQLAAALGVPAPAVEPSNPSPTPATAVDAFSEGAWLADPWLERLQTLRATLSGAPALAKQPKLGQARQATDQLIKLLKKANRGRDAKELARLRDTFMIKREKAGWNRVKARFTAMDLSQKAYRALRQEKADPAAVLRRLNKVDAAELSSMGATRLRQLLLG